MNARDGSQKSPGHTFEIGAHGFCSQAHIFGDRDAKDLVAAHRRILRLTAVTAGDEYVAAGICDGETMQAETVISLYQNNVSLAQVGLIRGLHVDRLSIANRSEEHTSELQSP